MESGPQNPKLMKSLQDLTRRRLFVMAEESCLEHLESHPNDYHVQLVLAGIYYEVLDFGQSLSLYENIIQIKPDHWPLYRLAAVSALRSGKVDKALEFARAYHEAVGDIPEALTLLLDIFERNNRIDEAEEILANPSCDSLERPSFHYFKARILIQRKKYEEAIDLITPIVRQELYSTSGLIERDFWFLLAKIHDRMGEYDLAWGAAESAHATENSQWSSEMYELRISSLIETLDGNAFASLARASKNEERPVFIVGNPRSGTSLLEQILGMHPSVENGGELSITTLMKNRLGPMVDSFLEWPANLYDLRVPDADKLVQMYANATESVCPGATVVTNKSLSLQEDLCYLSLLFDKGKAINLRRHPLDNCVSCFMTSLSSAGHSYASSLDSLASTWIGRRRLQDHWPQVIDMPILELHYENLVANQEHETRRLLEFLELPWHDQCLEFHTSKRVARTISYDQVNQKMYSSSSGRWRNYEKHLGPLIDRLSEYL